MEGSNNWERVSYGKKKDSQKLTKQEKKKINENMPKVHDLDHTKRSAIYQVATTADEDDLDLRAYGIAQGNGDSTVGAAANGNGQSQHAQQQQQHHHAAKPAAPAAAGKRQPANNIEILQSLTQANLEHAYQRSKDTIPDSPLAWLIDICAIIDQEMVHDKKEEWNRSDLSFPSSHLPQACRQFLVRLLEAVTDDVKRRFFLHACQRLVKQTERQAATLGTRAVMQLALRLLPQMPGHETCRPKLRELFDSARSTRAAFAAVMWSLGQGAYKDRATGLQALIDCALPAADGQLLATRWAAPDILDTLDELTRDPAALAGATGSKLTLRHAVGLADAAAATGGPGQTRDRLLKALARLRPTWQRLAAAAAATSDLETARHLLAALRRWETAAPAAQPAQAAVDLVLQSLLDCLKACPALVACLPLLDSTSAHPAVDLRLVRLALSPTDPAFGRPARVSLATRLASAEPSGASLPADVAEMVADGVAEGRQGRRGRRRGGGLLGGCCSRVVTLTCRLLLLASIVTVALLALALLPRRSIPSVILPVRDYLEERMVLYHVRRIHSDCQVAYRQRVAPFLMRRWDELAAFYLDTVLPAWRLHVSPRLDAVCLVASEFYAKHLGPALRLAWTWTSETVTSGYRYVEAEMQLYFPNFVTALGNYANYAMEKFFDLVRLASANLRSLYASVMPDAAAAA